MSTQTQTAPVSRRRGAHRAATTPAPAGIEFPDTIVIVPAGRPAGPGRLRRTLTLTARAAVNLLLVLAVLTLLALAVGPRVLPYRTTTMLTGSMAPLINPGDVAVITAEPVADVAVGQVLQIQAPTPDHRVVTHRVTAVVRGADGSVSIRTKGDANQGEDPWLAKLNGSTAWQVRGVVPHLGSAIRALRHPLAQRTLIFAVPAALALWVLAGVWRREEDGQ
jgi:signal peptidase